MLHQSPGFMPQPAPAPFLTTAELCLQSGLPVTPKASGQSQSPQAFSSMGKDGAASSGPNSWRRQHASATMPSWGQPADSCDPAARPRISRLGMQALTGALGASRHSSTTHKPSASRASLAREASDASSSSQLPVEQPARWLNKQAAAVSGSAGSASGCLGEGFEADEDPPGIW